MATLAQLVETIAVWEGIDAATVRLFARNVREAGLITTGGRGPSAGKMTFADAANLLIAVNASKIAREAPEVVREYRLLTAPTGILRVGRFGEALEVLIESLATRGTLPKEYLSLALPPLLSREQIRGVRITFHKPEPRAELGVSVRGPYDEQGPEIHFSQISTLKPKLANKVTGIVFKFEPNAQKFVNLHPDGKVTWTDGTPWVYVPKDRKDTTTIGYETVSAVAFLLQHDRTKRVGSEMFNS
jgi:hypothetical protein